MAFLFTYLVQTLSSFLDKKVDSSETHTYYVYTSTINTSIKYVIKYINTKSVKSYMNILKY